MEFIVNYKIIISPTIDELSEQFTNILIDELSKCKNYFHIALSGGSTPKFLFKYLSKKYQTKINWSKIKFFWGDERCVPPDHDESNYKTTYDLLFSKIKIPEENIFRICSECDPDEIAVNYSNVISKNVPSRDNLPEFDLILLGLGEDGHTASIFPNSLSLFNDNKICAVSEHPVTHQKRITITGKTINNAKKIIFLVVGENKSAIVDIILNRKNNFEKLPAYYVNPNHGELIWLMDKTASRLIT